MTATTTVMFADLTGSTGVFETLGNVAATQTITALTQWIGGIVQQHGGRVVKTLGDGVLAVFPDTRRAIEAVVQMQREHERRQTTRGPAHQMQLQIGLDHGPVVEVDGDCYGDAVNVAARLSDMSGARQILVTDSVQRRVPDAPVGAKFHSMGPMPIRGKAQHQVLYRVEWQEDASTDMLTLPAFEPAKGGRGRDAAAGSIDLRYLDLDGTFLTGDMPVHLGRAREAEFVIADPRVSRLHARIEWRNGTFVLADLSSYGTCVRFNNAAAELKLRREECTLHDSGEIALGPEFEDFSVPTIRFALRLGR